jgi:hypothetical protein
VSSTTSTIHRMALGKTVITVLVLSLALLEIFPFAYSFAQVQSRDRQDASKTSGLILQAVNATFPASREEDIYSIPTEGDVYRITGQVLNNDTVRFSGVRVSAVLFDTTGQPIGEGSAHTSPSGIQSGATAPFEINFFNTSVEGGIRAISNYTLHVDGNPQSLTFR